jgi:hypothetical protein
VHGIGCANPLVVFDFERRKRRFEFFDDLIDVLFNWNTASSSRTLDVDSVFVSAGEKVRIESALAVKAS